MGCSRQWEGVVTSSLRQGTDICFYKGNKVRKLAVQYLFIDIVSLGSFTGQPLFWEQKKGLEIFPLQLTPH